MRTSHHRRSLWRCLLPGLPLLAAVLIVHGGPQVSSATQGGSPKQLKSADAGDCAACHGPARLLPKDHPATKGQAMKDCDKCHDGKKASRLWGKLPLSHLHQLQEVSCGDCHGSGQAQPLEMDKCLECHQSGEEVAKLTVPQNKVQHNPHESPHYGTELDCVLCHHAHAKSENYCAQCHDEKRVVP